MSTIKICDLCGKQCPEGEALQLRIQQTPIAFTFQTVDICKDCDEWLSVQMDKRRKDTITISSYGLVGGSMIASQDWVLRQKYLKALPSHRHTVLVGGTNYFTSYAGS